jgi:hypothetical protein
MIIINKIKKAISLLFGLLLIVYVFYRRVIKERIPHEILFQFDTDTVIFISLILGLLIFSLIMNIIKLLFNKNNKIDNNDENDEKDKQVTHPLKIKFLKFKTKLLAFSHTISNVMQNALDQNLEFLLSIQRVKDIAQFFSDILIPRTNYCHWIYYFFIIIPRMLVASFFFLDVYIFHYFYYFYKVLPLLLLPLCMKVIVYMLYFWGTQMEKEVYENVTVELFNSETLIEKDSLHIILNGDSLILKTICRFRKDIIISNNTMEYLKIYVMMHMFSVYLLNFDFIFQTNGKKTWIILINCIIQLLYIFSWAYILKKMLLP